ncbi:hypothetical protein CLV63_106167 [Murinocardiopsis flavida]|uniref:Spore-associated protein A n=1 Tax=Murinocardiopsis flavida TaxID=645275 RepID=A0A2P8DLM1_9ACTN|nr:spore-associated protein A [Murinocardiopsis flavida]PSK98119.1 hypothetical protein CLV63_106167 [Murinocardiopsis flavida]
MKFKPLAVGVATASLLLGSLVTAAPAAAAGYNGVCGKGFRVVNSADIGGKGTVFLTYNGSSGKNCVVTVLANKGKVRADAAVKKASGGPWAKDSGQFAQYAGPVHLAAAGSCVDWGGMIGSTWVVRTGTNCG